MKQPQAFLQRGQGLVIFLGSDCGDALVEGAKGDDPLIVVAGPDL